jgi:sulfur relay (sulfurtransferase) complex TusBCD TusD component (DsrE family)
VSRSRLGLLLATAPSEGDFPVVAAAVKQALSAGRDISLFLMDDGVAYALDPRIGPLLQAGVEVTVCAMDAEAHGLSPSAIEMAGVLLGSQHDHARILRDSDRFLSFT